MDFKNKKGVESSSREFPLGNYPSRASSPPQKKMEKEKERRRGMIDLISATTEIIENLKEIHANILKVLSEIEKITGKD